MPVVGVVPDEEGFAEQARRSQLGWRVRRHRASSLEPGDAFSQLALRPPEDVEACREAQCRFRIDLEEAFECHASVVLDAVEHLQVRPLRAHHRCAGLAKPDLEVVTGVAIADLIEITGQSELFGGVLADRLEQLILTDGFVLQQQ